MDFIQTARKVGEISRALYGNAHAGHVSSPSLHAIPFQVTARQHKPGSAEQDGAEETRLAATRAQAHRGAAALWVS